MSDLHVFPGCVRDRNVPSRHPDLYDMFNRREDTWCERVYSPWPDLHKVMKEQHIPLFALESQDPLKEFDFLGITLQYEMCYTNILQVLDLAEIPIWSKDRKKGIRS